MGQIKRVALNGQTIHVEVGEHALGSGPSFAGASRYGDQALELARELRHALTGYVIALTQSLEELDHKKRPAKVTVEFGLKLSADAKFYVANSLAEAGVRIVAEWELEK